MAHRVVDIVAALTGAQRCHSCGTWTHAGRLVFTTDRSQSWHRRRKQRICCPPCHRRKWERTMAQFRVKFRRTARPTA